MDAGASVSLRWDAKNRAVLKLEYCIEQQANAATRSHPHPSFTPEPTRNAIALRVVVFVFFWIRGTSQSRLVFGLPFTSWGILP